MKGYVAVQRKLLVILYTLWKKDQAFNPEFRTSGNQESKPLYLDSSIETKDKTAPLNVEAALDGLPCNQSPEALFSAT